MERSPLVRGALVRDSVELGPFERSLAALEDGSANEPADNGLSIADIGSAPLMKGSAVKGTSGDAPRSDDGGGKPSYVGLAPFEYWPRHLPRRLVEEAILAYVTNPNSITTLEPRTAAEIRRTVDGHPQLSRYVRLKTILARTVDSPGTAVTAADARELEERRPAPAFSLGVP